MAISSLKYTAWPTSLAWLTTEVHNHLLSMIAISFSSLQHLSPADENCAEVVENFPMWLKTPKEIVSVYDGKLSNVAS